MFKSKFIENSIPKLDLFFQEDEDAIQEEVPDEKEIHSVPFKITNIFKRSYQQNKHEFHSRNNSQLQTQVIDNKLEQFFNYEGNSHQNIRDSRIYK